MRVLVTGGAGFIGANLSVALALGHPEWEVIAFDNLHRRGSELNLPRLERAGARFVRGDVRDREALGAIDPIEVLIECSAEPSALVGMSGETAYPFETNLLGAYNCIELARRDDAQLVFLSTSRVYPYGALSDLRLEVAESRFELAAEQPLPGVSAAGIAEGLPLDGPRTLYGATKLAAELLIAEYAANFGLRAVIDRCGVVAGPWQMGRVDQGVFTFWLLHHHFGCPLTYLGYGGSGRQVRDLLHVDDLVALVAEQVADPDRWSGFVGNVGGGREVSLSLLEATEICRRLTGTEVPIGGSDERRPGDVPVYISDCSRLYGRTRWRPSRGAEDVLADILRWIEANEAAVAGALGFDR
ncbi:MAG: NAD-dependent epimerase/dehydratase family protein [Solirubrobacterales bacterium]|nr:NAD-dependent epimerase/dehydratase family protein [Solirubrobacterales bacterium]